MFTCVVRSRVVLSPQEHPIGTRESRRAWAPSVPCVSPAPWPRCMFAREALRPITAVPSICALPDDCDGGKGAAASSQPRVSLPVILSGDLALLVMSQLSALEDVAALLCSLEPLVPEALRQSARQRGSELVITLPLWKPWCGAYTSSKHLDGRDGFAELALWPVSVPACRWHPVPWVRTLRAPPVCRVTGSGRCAHGLCQKQEDAKPGVEALLRDLGSDQPDPGAHAPATAATRADAPARRRPPNVVVLAREALAFLLGALGRNDEALATWDAAADAGSTRALLDIGVRRYRQCDSAAARARLQEVAEPGASHLSPREHGLAVLKAHVHLGMICLDGQGKRGERSDPQARAHFVNVIEFAKLLREAPQAESSTEEEGPWGAWWRAEIDDMVHEAHEALESIERFTFFANGRP